MKFNKYLWNLYKTLQKENLSYPVFWKGKNGLKKNGF